MTQEYIIYLGREAVYTVLLVSAPMLGLALVVGLAIGIFQAVTSINEMTLTFIPKIIVVILALVIFAPWMMNVLLTFTINLFTIVPNFAK
ncbi:flagellar biosynthetic protein FliQ [candidate division KSB1 bacterium]|nr:MAG: flagellar biosynthetic protein FliQ [candidate division KSB1 bacterium]